MKHIIFNFVEPIVAIQRVRNEVFTEDEHTITCYNRTIRKRLYGALRDLQVNCKMDDNSHIILQDDCRIALEASNLNKFYVVRGYDDMQVLEAIDYHKED